MGGDGGRPDAGGILRPGRVYGCAAVAVRYGGASMDRPWDRVRLLSQHGKVGPQGGRDHFRERESRRILSKCGK